MREIQEKLITLALGLSYIFKFLNIDQILAQFRTLKFSKQRAKTFM